MKYACPDDLPTNVLASQLQIEHDKHIKTRTRVGYCDLIGSHACLGQMLLTFKYPGVDLSRIIRMLKQVNLYVSNTLYGRHAYKKNPEKNSARWIAVVERNTDDQLLHVHLLIIEPDKEYIRTHYKNVQLTQICSLIKGKWVELGGGYKGEPKYFESQEHYENLPQYLMKQYNIDSDHLLFEHAPAFKNLN